MANQHEVDYEKQFQEDLAKATALSLEQQALDDYRRAKKYGSTSVTGQIYDRTSALQHSHSLLTQARQQSSETASAYYAHLRSRYQQSRGNSVELAPPSISGQRVTPPPVPHRRYSEISNISVSTSITENAVNSALPRERSRTPPPTMPENDLISFSSPTSKQPENSTFEKLIEDLQKLQTTNPQTALIPLGPTAAAPMSSHSARFHSAPQNTMYAATAPHYPVIGSVAPNACKQLVPFTPPVQQQKVPLTQEELQKLYNMPHQQQQIIGAVSGYPHGHMGFISTSGMYPSQFTQSAPPTASAAAAYMAPQYPTVPRYAGFQYTGLQTTANYFASPSSTSIRSLSSDTGNVTTAASDISSEIAQTLSSSSVVKSQSVSSATSIPNGTGSSATVLRRQTPPARKQTRNGIDLIDLSQEDDSRVSVLEAFDPLLNTDDEVMKK